MKLYELYSSEIPGFLTELASTAAMQRLKGAGMDCGCEYTSFPIFHNRQPANRFDHSLGVGLIVWNFTKDIRQATAGLLHDIATPAFSHVVDFVRGDHENQEATEGETEKIISGSLDIQQILHKYGMSTSEVDDYHQYPIADNDIPGVSADRLEYTLKNMIRYGGETVTDITEYYADLTVIKNEAGKDELAFNTADICYRFVTGALPVFRLYCSDQDRYSMELLALILKEAFVRKLFTDQDLYRSEKEIIELLRGDPVMKERWKWYSGLYHMETSSHKPDDSWIKVSAKKRYVDPLVKGKGRAMDLFGDYRDSINEYLNEGFDVWLKGISMNEK